MNNRGMGAISKYRIVHNWSPGGVDKRDEGMDDELARDWLRAVHIQDSEAADDVIDRVHELVESDPRRGWRLMMKLVNYARDETDFFQIGRRVLPLLLKRHEDLFGDELEDLVRDDPRYRRIFKGQISSYVTGFIDRHNIGPSAQDQKGQPPSPND